MTTGTRQGINIRWYDHAVPGRERGRRFTEPDALREFLGTAIVRPTALKITHHDRPLWNDNAEDHEFVAVFWGDGTGALCCWDRDHDLAITVGTGDRSWEDDNVEIPAGSALPVTTIERALVEFLTTGQRPTCVEWKPDDYT